MNIKEQRKEFDSIIRRMKHRLQGEVINNDWAKAFNISLVKLQESRMWLGKCLEAEGHELPPEFADKAETKEME